jgi:hypothetical protein
MTLDILLVAALIAHILMTLVILAMFFMLSKTLTTLGDLLRGLQIEMTPLISDLRAIGANVAEASDGIRAGMQRVNRLTEALGSIGDDLEGGRLAVKTGVEKLSQWAAPWQSLLKMFVQK